MSVVRLNEEVKIKKPYSPTYPEQTAAVFSIYEKIMKSALEEDHPSKVCNSIDSLISKFTADERIALSTDFGQSDYHHNPNRIRSIFANSIACKFIGFDPVTRGLRMTIGGIENLENRMRNINEIHSISVNGIILINSVSAFIDLYQKYQSKFLPGKYHHTSFNSINHKKICLEETRAS